MDDRMAQDLRIFIEDDGFGGGGADIDPDKITHGLFALELLHKRLDVGFCLFFRITAQVVQISVNG